MEFEKMKEVIANVLNVDPEEIKPETTFTEDLGADSLDIVEMLMSLEEIFNLTIPDEKTQTLTTVQDIVDYI